MRLLMRACWPCAWRRHRRFAACGAWWFGGGSFPFLLGLVGVARAGGRGRVWLQIEAEAFAAACAEAAEPPTGGWPTCGRFRGLDLFVLDDIQALEPRPGWPSMNLMHIRSMPSRAGPAAPSARSGHRTGSGAGWPRRLVNRLTGGLAVRVDPPGLTSRRRYLLTAPAPGLKLTAGLSMRLLKRRWSIRTIDGWLARLSLSARVNREPIDAISPRACWPKPGSSPTLTEISIDDIVPVPSPNASVSRFASCVRPRGGRRSRGLGILRSTSPRSVTGLSFSSWGPILVVATRPRSATLARPPPIDSPPTPGSRPRLTQCTGAGIERRKRMNSGGLTDTIRRRVRDFLDFFTHFSLHPIEMELIPAEPGLVRPTSQLFDRMDRSSR